MGRIRDHGGLREWLRDLRSGLGFYHFADPDSVLPDGFPTRNLCGSPKDGAMLVWWFTPLCRRCKRMP
jgi:hypothetical protein